jgi:HK97 family phage prohead protease
MADLKLNSPVIRQAVIRALSEENKTNRQAEFVISNETPDSYGTVFLMSGWDLKRYENNPVVFYAHRSYSDNPDVVLGTSVLRIENNELIAVVTFETEDMNPLADKVWRKVQAGTLRMASIGANPKKGHYGNEKLGENRDLIYFDEAELIEWSIVPLGSNPDALKRSEDNMEAIRAEMIKDIKVIEPDNFSQRSLYERKLSINKKR